jgi:glucosamine 6-phosphate synthetase-like amidotransferase/phosphosugar isomerase protein
MCGIAGYSLSSASNVDRTLAAQALLAGIADRGADAVGYAYRAPGEAYSTVVKQRTAASRLLERLEVPQEAGQALIHVRDYTKGHPSIPANNHPVRHGPVVGIHNGIIVNDDEILENFECARAEPRMSVDSEAILALAAHSHADARAFNDLRGSMATAWFDERAPDVLYLARGAHRPLWIGLARKEFVFASTKHALEVFERYAHLKLRKHEVREGTFVAVKGGEVVRKERFRPDHEFVEEEPLPAVRAPGEREACLSTLAALLAA